MTRPWLKRKSCTYPVARVHKMPFVTISKDIKELASLFIAEEHDFNF